MSRSVRFDDMQDAIRQGRKNLNAGAKVHVMGDLEEELRDERTRECSAPDMGEDVIYHPKAQTIRWDHHTWCPVCGESSMEEGDA